MRKILFAPEKRRPYQTLIQRKKGCFDSVVSRKKRSFFVKKHILSGGKEYLSHIVKKIIKSMTALSLSLIPRKKHRSLDGITLQKSTVRFGSLFSSFGSRASKNWIPNFLGMTKRDVEKGERGERMIVKKNDRKKSNIFSSSSFFVCHSRPPRLGEAGVGGNPVSRNKLFKSLREVGRMMTGNWKAQASALLILIIVGGVFFSPFGTQGATFTFTQSSWSGGVTANTATHTSNQTNWTQYGSVTGITAGADVKLTLNSYTFTDGKLLGLWHMDNNWNDSAGGGNTGTASGATFTVSSKVGSYAGSFNGSSYVTVPDNDALDPTAITITSWVYPTSVTASGNIVSKGGNSAYRFRVSSDQSVAFFDRACTNCLSTAASVIPLNQWSHIAVTGNSSGLKIYVNGVLGASNAVAYGAPNVANALLIGSFDGATENFSGSIDEVAIYGRALTAQEILLQYNGNIGKVVGDFNAGTNSSTVVSGSGAGASVGLTLTAGTLSAKTDYATGSGARSVTISPDGKSVYVANYVSNTVSMYSRNTSTGTLSAKTDYATSVGNPLDVTISSDGTSVYTANYNNKTVSMYSRNTSTGTLSAKTDYTTSSNPHGVTISSDGTSVYVANYPTATVSMYSRNISDGTLSAYTDYPTGGTYSWGVTISADGTSVYVANNTSSNVSMYSRNTSTGTLSAKTDYATGSYPEGATISADGTSVYVGNNGTPTVSMYSRNTSTGTLSAKTDYATGSYPIGITISPDGTSVYTANSGGTVSMYSRNTSTGTLSGRTNYAASSNPEDVTISPDGASVYVANYASNTISMYSRNTGVHSGTFTSAPINTNGKSTFTTLSYATTLNGQTITMDVRAGDTATPDGTWTGWTTGVASGASIASLSGHQYIQYRANFATSDVFITPTLDSVTINYSQYGTGTLTSSVYDSGSTANTITKASWTATNTSGTETVQFQLRSSSDGNTWSAWCGYADCSGSTYFNTGNNGVALSGSHPLVIGGDDRYFQYKTALASAGALTPTLSSVSIQYAVNATPDFDASFGGNGITVSQIADSADANYGKIKIDYRIRDIDTTTGTVNPGFITPSLQYNTGSGFTSITSGYLNTNALDNKAVQEGSYTTYTAYWDAKSQIPETYLSTLQIKVTVSDNEAVNNTVSATDSSLSLDTKTPVPGQWIDASTTPATLTLSTTDDNSIQMKVSLNNDLSGASYETYNTTKTITLASDPDTVYIQYRDSYGNETATQSITTPETPVRMMVQDTSNLYAPPLSAEYRLFIAWGTVLPTTPAFASYKIYRSPDNITYTLLDTVNSRTTNYYGDNSIAFDTLYYYKVETRDVNGNISYRSLPVSGKANGIQDAGEGGGGAETTAPTISTVTSTAISTTEATITWETNELATSTVGFTGTPSTFTNEIGVEGYTDNATNSGLHKVVLSGLTPNTPYYYRILSSDPSHNQGIANNGGTGYTFITNPGPAISGVALSNASNTKATITWNTDISADSTIRYATSVAGGSLVSPIETGTGTAVTSHSILLTSLTEGKTYYFSVKSQHGSDIATDTNGGDFYQFTTTTDTQAPTISSLAAGVIAYDRAALTWLTDEQATSQIKYATISGGPYTDTTETVTYGSDHFVILPSLSADTTYYFKAYSSDLSGNHILSPQNSFKTLQDPSYQHDPLTEITDISATLITDTNAVISLVTDQPALCSIEYGTAPNNYTATPVTESLENKQHRITLPSLLFATTYYYQATCIDNLDTSVVSDEGSFITLSEQVATGSEVGDVTAPSISGVGTSAVSGENATVTWKTDEVSNGYVNYGITNAYGEMIGDGLINTSVDTYVTDHTIILKNLIPSTKYYFQAVSSDAKGNLATSSESSFTTTSPSTISSISILSTKIGEATLTWKTSTNMSSIIEYGLTETYGDKQESGTLSQDHTITVSKLKSNVLYHFRVKGQDKDKNLYASSDYTYEPKSPPQLRNIQSKVLSDNEAQIDFISSVPTDALITYTNTKDSKDTGSQGTPELQTTHSVILKNLTAGATYTGNIIAKDEAGNEVTEILKSFTTSQDTTPPVIDQMKTDMALSQDGKVQAITSFTTNEPTTQSVTYKEGTDGEEKTAGVKTEYTTSHIAIITAFKPGSVYFLTAHTTDKSGNVSLSKERMVITPQRTENVVQMIISNFNDIFSWAKL